MKLDIKQTRLRDLPSVAALLEHEEVTAWMEVAPRSTVTACLRQVVEQARSAILDGHDVDVDVESIVGVAEGYLADALAPSLVGVINATGIVLHTGLGRAPLCAEAIEAIAEGAAGYCNLEYDLETGQRGRRVDHVNALLTELTGAEAATVVNNNAAATLLIVRVLAEGKELIVSRGQLVEIGGSFRIPDILTAGGAKLREVGTTNRTRIADYESAIGENTGAIMRVHHSNYRIVGFTAAPSLAELVELGHRHDLPVIDDVGSGLLVEPTVAANRSSDGPSGSVEDVGSGSGTPVPDPLSASMGSGSGTPVPDPLSASMGSGTGVPEPDPGTYRGLPIGDEPIVRESVSTGADLVCFSGDKLLGGPQCGIVVGKRTLIQRLERHPLMRTYRVGKLTLLALEATLRHWTDPSHAVQHVPTLSMMAADTDELATRARELEGLLSAALPDEQFRICSGVSQIGGGSLPGAELETITIEWRPTRLSAGSASERLRVADTPVVARVHDEAVCFDLRTIALSDFEDLVESVAQSASEDEDTLSDEGE
ncbi:MAG: L-seryl-tRNA(Sec) selenium transferase, partial [Planctomycetes bacterium]|nr:L-seryl-tRNA(Sec) selenium transferase [Planctomycetota bacterium]